jgi:hypothetical protein
VGKRSRAGGGLGAAALAVIAAVVVALIAFGDGGNGDRASWPGGGWNRADGGTASAASADRLAGGAQLAADEAALAAALAWLDALPAPADPGAAPSYEREAFLPGGWADLDRDGCHTRNEILQRDLADVAFLAEDPGCKVASGRLTDPYTGAVIDFERAESTTTVQVDHIVPLAQAWRAGAWRWTKDQRQAFANDPAELLAVDGAANQAKGDQGPSEWLPELNQCGYAAAYANLAGRYELAIPAADADALRRVLTACAD